MARIEFIGKSQFDTIADRGAPAARWYALPVLRWQWHQVQHPRGLPQSSVAGLSALGVDKNALVSWQALYYSSKFGKTEAMKIAEDLLYTSDIRKPSAFMWNHTAKAWCTLQGQAR